MTSLSLGGVGRSNKRESRKSIMDPCRDLKPQLGRCQGCRAAPARTGKFLRWPDQPAEESLHLSPAEPGESVHRGRPFVDQGRIRKVVRREVLTVEALDPVRERVQARRRLASLPEI